MRTSMRQSDGHSHDGDEKAYDANPLSNYQSGDDSDSPRTSEDAQAGVKRIEAVSKAWTLTSLIVAYVTYVAIAASQSDQQVLTFN